MCRNSHRALVHARREPYAGTNDTVGSNLDVARRAWCLGFPPLGERVVCLAA